MPSKDDCPLQVLVIDDQKAMRSILRGLLNRIGIKEIAEASSGQEGLDHLADPYAGFPDVVICDLHMEDTDGLQFCNAVRRNDALKNRGVPILMLTGDRDKLLHEVSKQVGALTVMHKPITAQELKEQITRAVGYVFA